MTYSYGLILIGLLVLTIYFYLFAKFLLRHKRYIGSSGSFDTKLFESTSNTSSDDSRVDKDFKKIFKSNTNRVNRKADKIRKPKGILNTNKIKRSDHVNLNKARLECGSKSDHVLSKNMSTISVNKNRVSFNLKG